MDIPVLTIANTNLVYDVVAYGTPRGVPCPVNGVGLSPFMLSVQCSAPIKVTLYSGSAVLAVLCLLNKSQVIVPASGCTTATIEALSSLGASFALTALDG